MLINWWRNHGELVEICLNLVEKCVEQIRFENISLKRGLILSCFQHILEGEE